MNAVYIRIFVYVLSAVLGLLPASWAGASTTVPYPTMRLR